MEYTTLEELGEVLFARSDGLDELEDLARTLGTDPTELLSSLAASEQHEGQPAEIPAFAIDLPSPATLTPPTSDANVSTLERSSSDSSHSPALLPTVIDGLLEELQCVEKPRTAGVKRAAPSSDDGDSPRDDGDSPRPPGRAALAETSDEKKQRRMQRNRESAAQSRTKKNLRLKHLEHRVVELDEAMASLQAENAALKRQLAAAGLRPPAEGTECAVPVLRGLPAAAEGPEEQPVLRGASIPVEGRSGMQHGAPQPASMPSHGVEASAQARSVLGAAGHKPTSTSVAFLAALSVLAYTSGGSGWERGYAPEVADYGAPTDYPAGAEAQSSSEMRAAKSPGARALLALPDSLAAADRDRGASPCWPAADGARGPLSLLDAATLARLRLGSGAVPLLPSPSNDAAPAKPALAPSPPIPSPSAAPGRLVELTPGSSWLDALVAEAEDDGMWEGDAALYRRAQPVLRAPPLPPSTPPEAVAVRSARAVVEGAGDGQPEESRRHVFCSRAYAFDAAPRGGGAWPESSTDHDKTKSESESEVALPASMPARFRHAARQHGGSNASARPPLTLNFLLPPAALHGVAGLEDQASTAGVALAGASYMGAQGAAGSGGGLVQLTCQVTNVSKVTL